MAPTTNNVLLLFGIQFLWNKTQVANLSLQFFYSPPPLFIVQTFQFD